jgi:hypothetical protein
MAMLRGILILLFTLACARVALGQSTPDLETTMCPGDTAWMTVSVTGADSLQWYHNGNVLFGSTKDTLVATEGGLYYLKAFHGQCYDVSGDIRIFTAYPRANDDYVLAPLNSLTTFDVLENDNANCAPFDPAGFTIVSQPTLGTLVSAEGGKIVYKPPATTLGTDKFTYRINDVEGRVTNIATVSVELYLDCGFVYPNPVADRLNITVNNKKIHAIEIYDGMGRLVYHTVVSSLTLHVDMNTFAQGFYLLKFLEHDGPGCTIKVQRK